MLHRHYIVLPSRIRFPPSLTSGECCVAIRYGERKSNTVLLCSVAARDVCDSVCAQEFAGYPAILSPPANSNLTLSSTEVGRFSGHSRRLHGSHSTRVLGSVNTAPVSHSSFLLGARFAELFSTRRFTSPSAGTVSSSDTLTQTLSTITFNPERRMKVSRTQFISMNKFRSFLAPIW